MLYLRLHSSVTLLTLFANSYTCDPGFTFDGGPDRTRNLTCMNDGQWNPPNPGTCEREITLMFIHHCKDITVHYQSEHA